MRAILLTPQARRDASAILRYSRTRFSEEARARYGWLLLTAYADLRANPDRRGVRMAGAELPGVRLYHLRHSRSGAPTGDRVRAPRHYIAFRADQEEVTILRVLHDSMDLDARLKGVG